MNLTSRLPWMATILLLALPVAQAAATPDSPYSTATSAGGAIYVCPGGDGQTLADTGATITVTLRDHQNQPIVGFPAEDLHINAPGFELIHTCGQDRVYADGPTDEQGQTTFSGTWPGGSWATDGIQVYGTDGMLPIIYQVGPVLPIEIVSPDSNGDSIVDLVDVVRFAADYLDPAEPLRLVRSDFNHDGTLGLGDLAILAVHMGHTCP